jgi:OmcA/MtrC family decaheme c-type cytochrome
VQLERNMAPPSLARMETRAPGRRAGEEAMARRGWSWAAMTASALLASACGSSSSESAAAPPPAATSTGALTMVIESVTLPAGDGARPVVRFHVTDNTTGQPLNMMTEIQNSISKTIPNTVPRFTLSQRDDRNDYRSYYASTVNAKAYTVPDGMTTPPTSPQLQASAQPPTNPYPIGDLKDVGGGSFELTLPATNQTGFDRTKTHTVAGWSVRSNGTADSDVAAASLDFVPGGGTPTSYATVTDDRCNQCHGFVQAHGSRRTVPLCITCHNPSTGDPETSRTVDFKVMIHKIHSGSTLPSVQQGDAARAAGGTGPGYFIVGFNQTVVDFSDVVFPYHNHGVQHCTVCHSGGAQSDNWKIIPTVNVCTSCHDNVQFASAAGLDPCPIGTAAASNFKDCLHTGGPIPVADTRDPAICNLCHAPGAPNAIDKYHHGD